MPVPAPEPVTPGRAAGFGTGVITGSWGGFQTGFASFPVDPPFSGDLGGDSGGQLVFLPATFAPGVVLDPSAWWLTIQAATFPVEMDLGVNLYITDLTAANTLSVNVGAFNRIDAGAFAGDTFRVNLLAHMPAIVGADLSVDESGILQSASGGTYMGRVAYWIGPD